MKKGFIFAISLLLLIGLIILRSVAIDIFPLYFLYLFLAVLCFLFFSRVGYSVLSLFSWHFYFVSVVLLVLTFLIGHLTRGVVRWIPIGPLAFQPTEIVRPFLLVFFANFLTRKEVSLKRLIKAILLFSLPVFLILIQPSLGVAILTVVGFIGILLALELDRKIFVPLLLAGLLFLPLIWHLMAPYQKGRILSFFSSIFS